MRGRDGHILSRRELSKELPNFIDKDLVEIGEHSPLHESYSRLGVATQSGVPFRLALQMSLIGEYVTKHGDITVLKSVWSKAGMFTGYASSFQDFDWDKSHLTVSPYIFW